MEQEKRDFWHKKPRQKCDGNIFFGSDVTWLSFYCIKVFFELKAKIIFQLTFCNKTNDAVNEII